MPNQMQTPPTAPDSTIKIAVMGTKGRMAKALIQAIKKDPATELIGKGEPASVELFKRADAVLDFTTPEASLQHAVFAAEAETCILIGTTGFTKEQMELIVKTGELTQIIQTGNTSVGANVMVEMVRTASRMMRQEFEIHVIDIHHKEKKDSPSGTAEMLSDTITANRRGEVKTTSIREGIVIGEHGVVFKNENESLTLGHKAMSRCIFAEGAIHAVKWLFQQPTGFYSMSDMLRDQNPAPAPHPARVQIKGKPQ